MLVKKTIISLLLVTVVGCSCSGPSQTNRNSCINTCDQSLISCVQTLGPDHKLDCHKTYDMVCMPMCSKSGN